MLQFPKTDAANACRASQFCRIAPRAPNCASASRPALRRRYGACIRHRMRIRGSITRASVRSKSDPGAGKQVWDGCPLLVRSDRPEFEPATHGFEEMRGGAPYLADAQPVPVPEPFSGRCPLPWATARTFYVISREIPPVPVPETRASQPRPLVVDRRPRDVGDYADRDELRWRPSAGPRSTTEEPGLAAASRSSTPARWPAGEVPVPHARRRRRFVESAGVPGALLQEGLPRPNRAGDSRPLDGARRRQPTGSTPRMTGDRGAGLGGVHIPAPRLMGRKLPASANPGRANSTALGCRQIREPETQDSVTFAKLPPSCGYAQITMTVPKAQALETAPAIHWPWNVFRAIDGDNRSSTKPLGLPFA